MFVIFHKSTNCVFAVELLFVYFTHTDALDVVDRITADHDRLPINWKEDLLRFLPVTKDAYF